MFSWALDGVHRSKMGNVKDQRVPYFIEPVHTPKRKAGTDQIPVSSLYFNGVDVDDCRKERYDIPLELASVAKNTYRLSC